MTEKNEGGKNRSRLPDDRDSSRPITGCGNQYSTSISALQEEVSERFAPKKARSLRLAGMYRELAQMYEAKKDTPEGRFAKTFDNKASRVECCGFFLEFHVTEGGKYLHKASFCRDRFCPMCNWRRSLKIFGQVSQIMTVLEAQKYRFLFLTLTVRNCSGDDFKETVSGMFNGWRVLYHDYFRRDKNLKRVICGTFRSLEVTVNHKNGTFHPHFHVILAVKPDYFASCYIKQEQWAEMWRTACGLDYKPVVDIRTVKPKKDKQTGEMSISSAVAEVSKYAAKDDDYIPRSDGELEGQFSLAGYDRTYYLRILLAGLRGRRLVDMTGCFREVKERLGLDDAESGDLVHVEADELREDIAYLIVRYQWRNGVYVESVERPSPDEILKAMGPIVPTDEEMHNMNDA